MQAAADTEQLEVCRYLLRETTWPDQARTLNNALTWFNRKKAHIGEKAVELYRMVAKAPAFDVDLEDTSLRYGWLEHCANMQCLDLVLKHQAWNFDHMSVEARFELALQITNPSIGCSEIVGFIGLRPSDQKLASLRSSSGTSLLHYIARRITMYVTPSGLKDWLDLGVIILKSGADLSSIALRESRDYIGPFRSSCWNFYWGGRGQKDHGLTPFMELIGIRSWGIDMDDRCQRLPKNIRTWVKMVQRAGIDLRDYGTNESLIWKSLGSEDHTLFEGRETNYICRAAKIEQLIFGPTPADWSLLYREDTQVPVFQQHRTPGTYPGELDLPATVIWCPTEQEETNGPWERQPRIAIASTQRDLNNLCVQEEDPFTQLVDGTQDDSGTIMLTQYRISRPLPSRSRSHSQPLSIQCTRVSSDIWLKYRSWLGYYHLCPFDSRRRPGCARLSFKECFNMPEFSRLDLRSCVQGISAGHLFSLQESHRWRWWSYLGDIASCQDKLEVGLYQLPSPKCIDHTQDRDCPWGCYKVDLSRIRVPESLRDFHPRRKYEET